MDEIILNKRGGESMPCLNDNTLLTLSQADKSCAVSPVPFQKQAILRSQHVEENILSPTPEKTSEAYHVMRKNDKKTLPYKYKIILDFFNCMTSSLRLLRLCGKSPTFQNISSQVQILTGRKFDYRHLAQIKHVLPEVIHIRKMLEHDSRSMCMKPDIMITLLFDIVEGHNEQSDYIALSRIFASRLTKFSTIHLEVRDFDQAEVPEQFGIGEITSKTDPQYLDVLTSENEQAKPSHFSPSFTTYFSRKASNAETAETIHEFPRSFTYLDSITITEKENPRISSDSSSRGIICRRPVLATSIQENTPIKSLVDNGGSMLETPAQTTPKRSLRTYTCEGKDKTELQKIATPGSLTAKRSLFFSSVGVEDSFCNSTVFEEAEHDSKTNTPDGMGVIQNIFKEKTCPSALNICKEKNKLKSDKVPEGNKSYLATYDQPPVSLSDLILTIHSVFQSVNSRSITKEELVHKIIMYNCDIDENSNIVENIEQLEKVLPDWISRELTPSGDLLYSVRMVSDLNAIQDRLGGSSFIQKATTDLATWN